MPLIVFVILISQFATPFMFSGVGITLPVMAPELKASAVELALVETAFLGAYTAFMLPFGRLTDIMNKNTVFKAGLFLYTLTSLALGLVDSIGVFIAIRAIQGLAAAAMAATSMAIIVDVVPVEKRGQALGLQIGAIYAGLASAPFLAGLVTDHFGWRMVYYASAGCLALALVPALLVMRGQAVRAAGRLEFQNSLPLILGTMMLCFGAAELDNGIIGEALLGAGTVCLAAFLFLDRRSDAPLLPFGYLRRNRILSNALIIQMLTYACAFGMTFLFSLHLQAVQGYTAFEAGQVLIIGPVIMAVLAPISGRLTDRCSPRILVIIGIAFNTVAAALSVAVADAPGLNFLIAALVAQGLGFAIFSTPNMAIIMGSVERNRSGFASAMTAKTRSIGMVTSITIITLIMSRLMGETEVAQNQAGLIQVMQLTFTILTGFGIVATVMAFLAIIRHKQRSAILPQEVERA